MTIKAHAANAAAYLFACGVAFGAGALSIAMAQVDNLIYGRGENPPEKPPQPSTEQPPES